MLTGGYAGLGSATADALLRGKPRLLVIVGDNANKGVCALCVCVHTYTYR